MVEGSFGTERGNTGSARFSHALGAVIKNLVGVYFLPKKSEYHKDGKVITANWRFDMVYGCLGASEQEKGEYLMIDAYDPDKLKKLLKVFSSGQKSEQDKMVSEIKLEMKKYADDMFKKTYGTKKVDFDLCLKNKRRSYLYNNDTLGRLIMFNVAAFTNQNFRGKRLL